MRPDEVNEAERTCLPFLPAGCLYPHSYRISPFFRASESADPPYPGFFRNRLLFHYTLHLSLYEEPVSGLYAPKHTDAAGPDTGRGQGGILQGKA